MDKARVGMATTAMVVSEHDPVHVINKYKSLVANPNYWHRLVIYDTQDYDRNFILKCIMAAAEPHDFAPFKYTVDGKVAFFMVNNCTQALHKLASKNFIVTNCEDPSICFKLGVILAYRLADPNLRNSLLINTQAVINKRFNSGTNTLNLEAFHKDPELTEFTPLRQHRLLVFVLHLSRMLPVHTLKLAYNELKELPPQFYTNMRFITSLDLRHNCLQSLSSLESASSCPVVELNLDGNPLCNEYDEMDYIKKVREMFPKVEKLDGLTLPLNGFLPFRRNFLCNTSGQDLVDQFLEYYFSIYDTQGQRHMLLSVYHPQAFFSLTVQHIAGQASSVQSHLAPYHKYSRNLKYLSDFSKGDGKLWYSNTVITNILTKLPLCEHDPYTFTIDLVQYTKRTATVVVTGVFKEQPNHLNDKERFLGFTRTFVLFSEGCNTEYVIVNDQLHIHNAFTKQEQRAFKQVRIPRKTYLEIPPAATIKEQNELVEAVVKLTELNPEWARKMLEECQYDLKKSLGFFLDLYKSDKIPKEAFELPEVVKIPMKNDLPHSVHAQTHGNSQVVVRNDSIEPKKSDDDKVIRPTLKETNMDSPVKKMKIEEVICVSDEALDNEESLVDLVPLKNSCAILSKLVTMKNQPGFNMNKCQETLLSTIEDILASPEEKNSAIFQDIYKACELYDLPERAKQIKNLEESLGNKKPRVRMKKLKKVINNSLQPRERILTQVVGKSELGPATPEGSLQKKYLDQLTISYKNCTDVKKKRAVSMFEAMLLCVEANPFNIHHPDQMNTLYKECEGSNFSQLKQLVQSYEDEYVQYVISKIKSFMELHETQENKDFIQKHLLYFGGSVTFDKKFDVDVFQTLYFATFFYCKYYQKARDVLQWAHKSLSKEDLDIFDDWVIEKSIKFGNNKSRVQAGNLIHQKIAANPAKSLDYVKYAKILKKSVKVWRKILENAVEFEENIEKVKEWQKELLTLDSPNENIYLEIRGCIRKKTTAQDMKATLQRVCPNLNMKVQRILPPNMPNPIFKVMLTNKEAADVLLKPYNVPKYMKITKVELNDDCFVSDEEV